MNQFTKLCNRCKCNVGSIAHHLMCERITEAEAKGVKHDSGKIPMELLSHKALEEIAKVFAHGEVKYGAFNYRGGIHWRRVIGAAYRHLGQFNSGEDIDKESGISHIAHLAACSIMLLDFIREHKELDDRYVPSDNKKSS